MAEAGADRLSQIAVGTAVNVAGALPLFATVALVTRIDKDFDFDKALLGIAIALYYATSALLSPVCGRLVTSIGSRRAVWIASACTVVASLGIAALAQSYVVVMALLLIAGCGNAMSGPIGGSLFQSELAPSRHGVALGTAQSGASIGTLLAGFSLPLLAIPLGWRWVYVAAAITSVVVASTVRPRHVYKPSPKVQQGVAGVAPEIRRTVSWIAVIAALACAAPLAMVSFLVVYSSENGMAEGSAGVLLGLVSALVAATRIGIGVSADRLGHPMLRLTTVMIGVSTLGYLLLIVAEPAAIVVGTLIVGASGWAWPSAFALASMKVAPNAGAWAVGMMMSGLFAGCVAGPLLAGLLAQHDLFAGVWIMCAAFTAIAAVALIKVRRDYEALGGPA